MQDFEVEVMEKLIAESSIPIVTYFDKDPENSIYVSKFFNGIGAKVL